MKYVSRISALLLLLVAFLCLSGCGYRDFRVESFNVVDFSSRSLRSFSFKAVAGVSNPAGRIVLSDISGTIKFSGKEFGTFSAESVTLDAKTRGEYTLNGNVKLNSSVSVMDMLSLNMEECRVSVSCKARSGGLSKKIKYEDILLRDFVRSLGL